MKGELMVGKLYRVTEFGYKTANVNNQSPGWRKIKEGSLVRCIFSKEGSNRFDPILPHEKDETHMYLYTWSNGIDNSKYLESV
jgi:hypothetical protein